MGYEHVCTANHQVDFPSAITIYSDVNMQSITGDNQTST